MSDEQKPAEFRVIKAGEAISTRVSSNVREPEDAFKNMYIGNQASSLPTVLEPPYSPYRLSMVVQENNMLSPCIETMVDNIDGTGYTFEAKMQSEDTQTEEDSKIGNLKDTFDTFVLGETFIDLRKRVRRDVLTVGYGFIEVIRNLKREIVLLRYVDAKTVRLIKRGEPVDKPVTVHLNGQDVELTVSVRERRFIQTIGPKQFVYFKEFGGYRNVDPKTGEWSDSGSATELMFFMDKPDATSPYGVPRWVHQMPAALGSRKSEEFNLDFFDNGGVPPVMLFLQGGTMSASTKGEIDRISHGSALKKNRMIVIELDPSSGSIDSPQQPRVVVERFGGDRQSDAMFSKYDAENSEKVRRAFRIAPIFLGAVQDFNYASAYTSYMVTEQQVFKPERDAFDTVITNTLLPELGYPEYKLVSNPMTLKNADLVLQTAGLVKEYAGVPKQEIVDAINEATGTRFTYDSTLVDAEEQKEREREEARNVAGNPVLFDSSNVQKPPPQTGGKPQLTVVQGGGLAKSEGMYAFSFELRDALLSRNKAELEKSFATLAQMTEDEQEFVRTALSKMIYASDDEEIGLSALAGCGATVLARRVLEDGED